MIEPNIVTRDTHRAVRIVCSGERSRRYLRALVHRQSRRHARTRLRTCADFDALIFEPKLLTGWEIA
jgi:hypothetical protein